MVRELVYKGSTKDIYALSDQELLFQFSDRYSIFDYGEMPDQILNKGKSTALFTQNIFKTFEKNNIIKTHLLKMGDSPNELIVKKFTVPRKENIKDFYSQRPTQAFIPLEVIFRFGAPKGSSLVARGFKEGETFKTPLVEFTTKLENMDRLISDKEAQSISGMNDSEFSNLKNTTSRLALHLKELVDSKGLILWDGKFEFAFGDTLKSEERELVLVDSISLDEIRITYKNIPLSKEILRQIYKNSTWYKELTLAKENFPESFRQKVPGPISLGPKVLILISKIYEEVQALIVSDQKDLKELDSLVKELTNEYNNIW